MSLDSFIRQYIATALWSSTDNSRDDGGDPLDDNYTVDDISEETMVQIRKDCESFYFDNRRLWQDRETWPNKLRFPIAPLSVEDEQAGHDFWLTRNGHGAGFWDGDYPEPQASALTNAAKTFGEFYLDVDDDGKVYGS